MTGANKRGLSAAEREKLLQRMASRPAAPPVAAVRAQKKARPPDDLSDLEFHKQIELMRSAGALLGIDDPYLRPHEARAGAKTLIGNREHLNFSSYDYLGLNGDPRVAQAAKDAIDRYGTSVSASRLVAGERPIHRQLEEALAKVHGTEDAVVFVSGHATNVTVIGHMLGRNDLILHDALIHNSVMQGARLAGAMRLSFPHNDLAALDHLLATHRAKHGRAIIVVEGCYSMDGDAPDLRALSEIARRHDAWLLVDEAHSLGVLGKTGLGAGEEFGLAGGDVDFWMGTLSKTLAGCGGYIAGSRKLVEYLKLSAPGFVYSVGMPPPVAAASLAALEILLKEPQRVEKLRANARYFLDRAKAAGFDTGLSHGYAIVPIITGSSITAARLSQGLLERGVNVQPILYPAVPERSARLRFFLSAEHELAQIDVAIAALIEAREEMQLQSVDLSALAARLSDAG